MHVNNFSKFVTWKPIGWELNPWLWNHKSNTVTTLYLSENDTDVAHYNFHTHYPIFAIFGRNVAESVLLNDGLLSHLF